MSDFTGYNPETEDRFFTSSLTSGEEVLQLVGSYREQSLDPRKLIRVENQSKLGSCAGHSNGFTASQRRVRSFSCLEWPDTFLLRIATASGQIQEALFRLVSKSHWKQVFPKKAFGLIRIQLRTTAQSRTTTGRKTRRNTA